MATPLTSSTLSDGDTKTLFGTYVIGKTRTGKSTFLRNSILNSQKSNFGPPNGICVLDAHGDLIEEVLKYFPAERADAIVLLDILDTAHPFGLNPFRCSDPNDPLVMARTVSRVMQIFDRLWGYGSQNNSWGPRLEQYLRNTTMTLAYHGLTMVEAPLLLSLTDSAIRRQLVESLPNPSLRQFWDEFEKLTPVEKERHAESTKNKLASFVDNPVVSAIVGQTQETVAWRQAMADRKIVLVKLDAQLPDVSALLGSVIVGRILEAAYSRTTDRNEFLVYADEFHRFATDDFAQILAEAGKFGVSATVAHQFRGQLDPKNHGATLNMANLAVFQVSHEDAKELAGNFSATPPAPTVAVERPKRIPSMKPIEHLLEYGHSDFEVKKHLKWIVNIFSDEKVLVGKKSPHFQYVHDGLYYKDEETGEFVCFEREAAVRAANDYLYDIMSGYMPSQGAQDRLYEQCKRWCAGSAIGASTLWDKLWDLGKHLHANPILVDSGQYETVLERPRTYSDVIDQIANELATLPRFTVRWKQAGYDIVLPISPQREDLTNIQVRPAGKERVGVEQEIVRRQQRLWSEGKPAPRPSPPPSATVIHREGMPPQVRIPPRSVPIND